MIRKEKVTMMIPTEVEQIVSAEIEGDYGTVYLNSNYGEDGTGSLEKAKKKYKEADYKSVFYLGMKGINGTRLGVGINVETAIELGTALLAMASYVKGEE